MRRPDSGIGNSGDVYSISSASTTYLLHAPLRSCTMKSFTLFTVAFHLNLSMFALAAPSTRPVADASRYDDPNHGPPVSLFTASPSLQNHARSLIAAANPKARSKVLDSYPVDSQRTSYSNIYGNWSEFHSVRRCLSSPVAGCLIISMTTGIGGCLRVDSRHGR
jgi:hypothetical protein